MEQVRTANDIVSVIQEYVPLKRKGREFQASCPFHDEKTPSFYVNSEKQVFKCWGCGAGGDVFNFVMRIEGVGFREALEMLARRGGVTLRQDARPRQDEREKASIYEVNAWAVTTYNQWLLSAGGRAAREYLESRRVSAETIERLQLGYAPQGWDNLLKEARRAGWPQQALVDAGLAATNENGRTHDRFSERVLFPIQDPQSRPVGFGGRIMGQGEPKYLNTGETRVFHKGTLLYLAERAKMSLRETRLAIVVEGYMDAIAAHECGLTNTVAVLGTALSADHVRYLKRFVDQAVLVFDADEAGIRAANRSLEAFAQEELEASVAILPDGLDPCDCIQQRGREAFEERLENATDGIAFRVRSVGDVASPDGSGLEQAKKVDEAIDLVAHMPNPVTRSFALNRVASLLDVPAASLRARLDRIMARSMRRERGRDSADTSPARRDPEAELIQVMLNSPDTIAWIQKELDLDMLRGDSTRRAAEAIFQLFESGKEITPTATLDRLHEDGPRELVGRVMDCAVSNPDYTDWARQLVAAIRGRLLREESRELRQEYARAAGARDGNSEEILRRFLETKRRAHAPAPGAAAEDRPAAPQTPPDDAAGAARLGRQDTDDVEF